MGEFTFFFFCSTCILDGQCLQLSGEDWWWSFVLVGVLDIPAIYQCMYGVTFNLYLHTLNKTCAPTFILAVTTCVTSWIIGIYLIMLICYIYWLTISVIWIILASVAFNFLLTMLRFFVLLSVILDIVFHFDIFSSLYLKHRNCAWIAISCIV